MTALGNILHSALSLGLLWMLLFHGIRGYRIDRFRQRLFAIRNELFDYAAEGNISFDDPTYRDLRQVLNSMIRFAHRVTFTRFVLASLAAEMSGDISHQEFKNWITAVNELKPDQRNKLLAIHSAMLGECARHMATGSPLFPVLYFMYSCINWWKNPQAQERLSVLEAQAREADRMLGFATA